MLWQQQATKLIASYEDALLKFESGNELKETGKVSELLGTLCFRRGEWNKAIEYYKKSLETFNKIGNVHGAAQIYNNLGLVNFWETWGRKQQRYDNSELGQIVTKI